MEPAPRGRSALAGAVAGVAGIVVAELVTHLLNAAATPVQAVAEVIIVKTPGPVAEALIHVVGRNDKPILVGGVTVVIVALGALAGLLTRRRRLLGLLVFWAMGAIALVAELSRPNFTPYAVLPLAAGVLVWTVLLDVLTGAARAEPTLAASRRRFLLSAGGVAVGAVALGALSGVAGRSREAVVSARNLLRLPIRRGEVPAGADTGVDGVAPWRSANDTFYRIDTALVIPAVDPNQWRIRIHGMVDREITLTYRELLARQTTQDWVTICCVSNEVGGELIGNAWWSGVRIADLLKEAGVSPRATAVKQTSKDGWTCGTPIEALTDGRNAMLAFGMNGEPLPLEHGFPVRMIVPGLYGYVSATKWVVDLEVTRFEAFSAYWTQRGWSERGPVKTESRIEVPRSGGGVRSGRVRVGGHAWAQHTGIEKVEFRLDGNAWQKAELGRVPNVDTWVQWSGTVQLDPGRHSLVVRATDRDGRTQTPVRAGVLPDGATGWHTVDFTAS